MNTNLLHVIRLNALQPKVWGSGLLLMTVLGCNPAEHFRKMEYEMADLKMEVFKLRQVIEESKKQQDADRKTQVESQDQDRRFRADLQDTMRQLQDSTRILNNRLNTVGKEIRSTRPSEAPTPASGGQTGASDDEQAFNAAVLDYNKGNYPLAAEGLQLFLQNHTSSAKRPDALFYMGLAQYHQKLYDKAQGAFDRLIREHATSNQYLPARLKRAQCLLKMGLKPAAVKAFKEIKEGFPGTPESRTAEQELGDLGL